MMSINILTSINQYNEGDDVWIFPDLDQSKPLKKLDWYLNFQVHNSKFKTKQPTIIPSHKKLPTKAVLSIPFSGDIRLWCDSISSIWKELKAPSIRLFLPDNIKNTSNLVFDEKLKTINVVLG